LNNDSCLEWCVLQLLPSMYNFSNTAQITRTVDGEDAKDMVWVNHYPIRLLTFYPVNESSDLSATFVSRYRGSELETVVELQVRDKAAFMVEESTLFRKK